VWDQDECVTWERFMAFGFGYRNASLNLLHLGLQSLNRLKLLGDCEARYVIDASVPYNILIHPFRKTNVPVYNVYLDISSVDSLKQAWHVKNKPGVDKLDGFIISKAHAFALDRVLAY